MKETRDYRFYRNFGTRAQCGCLLLQNAKGKRKVLRFISHPSAAIAKKMLLTLSRRLGQNAVSAKFVRLLPMLHLTLFPRG